MGKSAKSPSDHELRTIALGVHEGRIITNAEVGEHRWSLYALSRPLLQIEFRRLTRADVAKLTKFSEEIQACKKKREKVAKSSRKFTSALEELSCCSLFDESKPDVANVADSHAP